MLVWEGIEYEYRCAEYEYDLGMQAHDYDYEHQLEVVFGGKWRSKSR